jgi:hypothetical protein
VNPFIGNTTAEKALLGGTTVRKMEPLEDGFVTGYSKYACGTVTNFGNAPATIVARSLSFYQRDSYPSSDLIVNKLERRAISDFNPVKKTLQNSGTFRPGNQ